ncbi:MAG: hypothetical protein IJS20_09605, partial [Bacteroidales bacterium]|nr:hypothetical protein [Bacteroidales bacterium]
VSAKSNSQAIQADGNVAINGGTVNATGGDGGYSGIYSNGTIEINGGNVTASSIYSDGTAITLGWTRPADRITASSIRTGEGTVAVADGQALTDGSGHIYTGTLTDDEISAIAGQTLQPCLALADDIIGDETLANTDGMTLTVALANRTIDTEWNTIALPFDVTAEQLTETFGDGVKLYELTGSSLADGVLGLEFTSATSIEAGRPYFIAAASANVVNPTFTGVTIKASDSIASTTSYVDFIPTLGVSEIQGDRITDVLVLGGNNTLYNPASLPAKMKAFRGYFRVHDYSPAAEAMQFRMTFDDATEDDVTGIIDVQVKNEELRNKSCDAVYNLMGVRVKSADKGLFVVKGKKVIVR